jgi:hypothetical protein
MGCPIFFAQTVWMMMMSQGFFLWPCSCSELKMADEEIILLYIRRALSPTLGKHFLCTAAKHLADHGPMWETSIGVTFRFHRRLVSSDNPVEVLQHAETFFFLERAMHGIH